MLRELYYGNISPWDRKRIRTHEYTALTDKMESMVTHFENVLSPEEYAKLTEMLEVRSEITIMDELDVFKYAFRTSALLMVDIFDDKEND
jgi:hypothetical protein